MLPHAGSPYALVVLPLLIFSASLRIGRVSARPYVGEIYVVPAMYTKLDRRPCSVTIVVLNLLSNSASECAHEASSSHARGLGALLSSSSLHRHTQGNIRSATARGRLVKKFRPRHFSTAWAKLMEALQLKDYKEVQAGCKNMACRLAVAVTDRLLFRNRWLICQPSLFDKSSEDKQTQSFGSVDQG